MSIPEPSSATPEGAAPGSQPEGQSQPTIDWEKRFKDTQADYTRKSQENAKLRAELEALKVVPKISAEVQAELDELKYRDPDAWKARLDSIDSDHRKAYNDKLSEITGQLTAEEQRKIEFSDFMASHPGFHIDDDVINNDIPRRITAKLEKGEVTLKEFLEEAHEFLTTPRVIANSQVPNKPNLDKMGGGANPSAASTAAESKTSYKNEVY